MNELKLRVLLLAGYLADGEAMTAVQGQKSLPHVVADIFSDKGLSPVAGALIAVELACQVDEMQRAG